MKIDFTKLTAVAGGALTSLRGLAGTALEFIPGVPKISTLKVIVGGIAALVILLGGWGVHTLWVDYKAQIAEDAKASVRLEIAKSTEAKYKADIDALRKRGDALESERNALATSKDDADKALAESKALVAAAQKGDKEARAKVCGIPATRVDLLNGAAPAKSAKKAKAAKTLVWP